MSFRSTRHPRSGGQKSYGQKNSRPFQQKTNARQGRPRRGAYIHPSKFINKATTQMEEVVYVPQNSFADFPFHNRIQQNISYKGYTTPSPIQDQAILPILNGQDVIGLANTGTGKTAAFLLPIINKLLEKPIPCSVLILAPTRELAIQIDEQFKEFSAGMKLYSVLLVGGTNMGRQISQLQRRPHVIIGTPGRTMDHIRRKYLRLNEISVLVLDEADRMLDMGFIGDIRTVVSLAPVNRQTLFFSATMTPQISQLTNEFLKDPVMVSVKTSETSDHVDQDVVYASSKEEKIKLLLDMLNEEDFDKVLLFGETKFGVQRLSDHLSQSGISSAAIHGNKSQSQRQRALHAFKNNQVSVLVATDVAARGLDIPNVSHVINFDQPATYEDYVHRIGRTGRGGAKGKALTFVSSR